MGTEHWLTPFSYAIIAVVSFMQGDYASLDFWQPFYQEKGWSATAAIRGKVVYRVLQLEILRFALDNKLKWVFTIEDLHFR